MVSGERLDEIERELDRVTPATGPEEPPEDPTPDELSDWYEKAQENPEVDYWEAYFKMIEEVEKLKDAGVIGTAGPRAGVPDIEAGEYAEPDADDPAGSSESGETDAHADSSVDLPDGRSGPARRRHARCSPGEHRGGRAGGPHGERGRRSRPPATGDSGGRAGGGARMSDGPLAELREHVGGGDDETDETDDETGLSNWFDALRAWYRDGTLRDAAREQAGRVVIRVGRKARAPYEVASDPNVHITAKGTMRRRAADNDDPRDQRNIDLDRPCRRERRP